MIKTLEANFEGRDFVCGDIHGSFSCVTRFMEGVQFDTTKDRLICTGDLIDRGPENEKCLELLFQPWFHCARGNHEDLMESYFKRDWFGERFWPPNGGSWGMHHRNESSDVALMVQDLAIHLFPKLPLLITVKTPSDGRFHVIHAELWPSSGQQLTDELLENEDEFVKLAFKPADDGHCVIWGRKIFMSAYKTVLDANSIEKFIRTQKYYKNDQMFGDNLSPIFSGHTPIAQPLQFMKQTNLDTMAYASYHESAKPWYGLTIAEPNAGKFWFANDREFKKVEPIVINP